MPMYEYACKKCAHTFEALVFDGDTVECPQCQSVKLERLMSMPGLARSTTGAMPMASSCGPTNLPPCGAPWCQRTGKG